MGESIAWDPFREFAWLLCYRCADVFVRVADRLTDQFPAGPLDVEPLASEFTLTALPRALRTFDLGRGRGAEAGWLRKVYSRYATAALSADLRHRQQLLALRETYRPTPAEEEEAGEKQHLLGGLLDAVRRLPETEGRALELYYGLADARELTLAQVAARLGCSEYLARAAVLHGLMQLAAEMGVQGGLEDHEYRFLRLYFEQGRDLENTCHSLRLPPAAGRDLLRHVQQTFVRALRRRTVPGARAAFPLFEENAMRPSGSAAALGALTRPAFVEQLLALDREPAVRGDEKGHWFVLLGAEWVRISEVRKQLSHDEATQAALRKKGVRLGWLAIPDLDLQRADTRKDADSLEAALVELQARAFEVAERVAGALLLRASERGVSLPAADPSRLAEHVLRALEGVVLAIEADLPRSAYALGEARFRVERVGRGGARGSWEGGTSEPFDLADQLAHEAELSGGLGRAAGECLAGVVLDDLFAGDKVFPGLDVASADGAVLLVWHRPSHGAR